MAEPKDTIWVVQWNYGGFHPVRKMTWDGWNYWDKTGDYDYNPSNCWCEGHKQVAFDTKEEAQAFRNGVEFARTCLKEFI